METVGIRCPGDPVARELIRLAGVPIAAPSANVSGRPSPTAAHHVVCDLDGRIDCIIDGGESEVGLESTIVKIDADRLILLRPGAITPEMLSAALSEDVKTSFNMVSVDGDTSTNDMVSVMANGLAGNELITEKGEAYTAFCEALHAVTSYICRMIAADGEGATKLLECVVDGAIDEENAKIIAKSVICSSLFKAAMFGADANWGRVLCAIGYSGADVDVQKVDVSFRSAKGEIAVCKNGSGIEFSEEKAKEILLESEIQIFIELNDGVGEATAWGCDLTYDYVKINGDYRT